MGKGGEGSAKVLEMLYILISSMFHMHILMYVFIDMHTYINALNIFHTSKTEKKYN